MNDMDMLQLFFGALIAFSMGFCATICFTDAIRQNEPIYFFFGGCFAGIALFALIALCWSAIT